MPERREDGRSAARFVPPGARRASSCVIAVAWIATTAAIVEPLQAAMLNWDELAIGLSTMLRRLVPIALVILAGLVPLALATCWLLPARALALWTALCVALWIQADLFVWHYGSFDGAPLDWSAHRSKAWLEAAVWLGAPAFALWRPDRVARHALRILAGIVILQGAGLAATAYENAPFATKPTLSTRASDRAKEIATFSSTSNAIIVVLDMVQSDFFSEAMQSAELASKMPEGFVHYRNAISLYKSTQFSLQSMLTSRAAPSGIDAFRWRDRAMRQSLPVVLEDHGFDSALVSFSPHNISCGRPRMKLPCTSLRTLSGLSAESAFEIGWRTDASLLWGLGLFRLAPHWLKPLVYDAGEWRIPEAYPLDGIHGAYPGIRRATRTDLVALDNLTAGVRRVDGAPRFRFLHLNGVHYPAAIDARCQTVARGSARERAVETTSCMLRSLYRFFDALDEAGVYDPSLIVVLADHGHPRIPLDPSVATPPIPAQASGELEPLAHWSSGVPMFLVKAPNASGPLRSSDRPVSLCDVPATVLDVLRIKAPKTFECGSVLDPTRTTPRFHYRYPNYREQKRLSGRKRSHFDFERIRVKGHSWRRASWTDRPVRLRSR